MVLRAVDEVGQQRSGGKRPKLPKRDDKLGNRCVMGNRVLPEGPIDPVLTRGKVGRVFRKLKVFISLQIFLRD